jgi:hypothetical protein
MYIQGGGIASIALAVVTNASLATTKRSSKDFGQHELGALA